MRLLSFLAGLTGLFLAGALAAQTPAAQPASPPPPPPPLEAESTWYLDLSTGGRVAIQLRPDVAPATVERIRSLTRRGFYDGLVFHRVIEGFMAQGGDPTGTGASGSDLPDLPAEIHGLPHLRGAVAMARAEELNSANSQFYIMFVPRLNMDRNYTVFGRVVSGMSFVDAIERGEPPSNPTRIVRASIGADNVPLMSADALRAAPARSVQARAAPLLPPAAATSPPAAATPPVAESEPAPAPAAEPTPEPAPPSPAPAEGAPPAPVPAPPAAEPRDQTTPPQPVAEQGAPPAEGTTSPPPAPEPEVPTPASEQEEEEEAAPPPTGTTSPPQ